MYITCCLLNPDVVQEWWASQFSTVPKMQIRPRAQIPRVKEIQAKPGNLSICFGLFCFISASILSCGMLSVIPAAFPLLSRVLLEFSSCKTDIDSLRQDLIALNTSVRTPSSTTIPLKPCSTEVQRTPQDEKGRYLFAELNTTRSLSQNITLRDTIGQFGFSSTVKKDVNKSRLSLEMHNTTMSCLNSSKVIALSSKSFEHANICFSSFDKAGEFFASHARSTRNLDKLVYVSYRSWSELAASYQWL